MTDFAFWMASAGFFVVGGFVGALAWKLYADWREPEPPYEEDTFGLGHLAGGIQRKIVRGYAGEAIERGDVVTIDGMGVVSKAQAPDGDGTAFGG